jgi:hypothetical protein
MFRDFGTTLALHPMTILHEYFDEMNHFGNGAQYDMSF